ncbi:PIN domain-containing protein [Candidatus Dojkabacteria bacterium]|nr:PIN domain-containing protein [Candidatus Dojkabacteria bacterium]
MKTEKVQKGKSDHIQLTCLVDTDIIIDGWRGLAKAADFINSIKFPKISILTYFELINGCKKKTDIKKVVEGVKSFSILELDIEAQYLGLDIFTKHKLKDGIGIYDSLIAASAIYSNLPLITRNVKHYNKIKNINIFKPY